MKSVALILTQSPFANSASNDALDMSMVLGSFEVPTALFFVGDAVRQFASLQPEKMNIKNFTKSFSALPFYDIEALYIRKADLEFNEIPEAGISDDFEVLDEQGVQSKLATFDRVILF